MMGPEYFMVPGDADPCVPGLFELEELFDNDNFVSTLWSLVGYTSSTLWSLCIW